MTPRCGAPSVERRAISSRRLCSPRGRRFTRGALRGRAGALAVRKDCGGGRAGGGRGAREGGRGGRCAACGRRGSARGGGRSRRRARQRGSRIRRRRACVGAATAAGCAWRSRRPRRRSWRRRFRARVPCALLGDDGACSVYAARPLACRAASSLDAGACARALDRGDASGELPIEPWGFASMRAAYAGLRRALSWSSASSATSR